MGMVPCMLPAQAAIPHPRCYDSRTVSSFCKIARLYLDCQSMCAWHA